MVPELFTVSEDDVHVLVERLELPDKGSGVLEIFFKNKNRFWLIFRETDPDQKHWWAKFERHKL